MAGRVGGWLSTRRQALRAVASAATAVAGGAVVAGCGSTKTASGNSSTQIGVLPVPSSGVVHVVFQPNQQFIGWNKTTATIFQEFVDQNFNTNPKYKGIWATIWPSGWGGGSQQITATIAGSGYADVFHMCCSDIPLLEQSGILQPLDDLLRRDNIDTTVWSKGHLLADSYSGKLYGLPSYDGTTCFFYRQDILDQLGLEYPDGTTWTGADAAKLWAQCAGKMPNGSPRYGASFYYDSGTLPFWLQGWGASYGNADLTQATMATPQGAEAVDYVMGLYQSKAAYGGGQDTSILPVGRAVFAMYHSAHVIDVGVKGLGDKFKWNILPSPIWGTQRTCFETIDCYMLNGQSKNVDEAWTVLKWVSGVDPSGQMAWPKFQIDISLVTPALVSLWDYWQTTLVAVAPPLKNKDLKWFYDAAAKGYNVPTQYFKYQPLTADGIVSSWMNKIQSQQVDAAAGLQQMQQQVNALESVGAQEAGSLQSEAKLFPTNGPDEASLPAGI